MSLHRLIIGASLLAFAAACATPPAPLPVETVRRGMLTDSQQKIATTEILLPIRQKDIYVYTSIPVRPNRIAYASGGGGVAEVIGVALGVAIADAMLDGQDQSTRDAAEAAAKPVRAGLAGFNFDETLQADLKTSLVQLPWLNPDGYRVLKEISPSHPIGPPTSSGRLIISADYRLSAKADELIVTLTPTYYFQERTVLRGVPAPAAQPAADGTGAAGPNPAPAPPASWTDHLFYKNVLTFRMRAPNAGTDTKNNACEWSFNNSAVARSALQMASSKLTQMLVTDLQEGLTPPAASAAAPEQMILDNINGVVVSRDPAGALVRLESGSMAFVANPLSSAYTLPPAAKPPCGPLPKPAAATSTAKTGSSAKRSS
ncbi:MAG TPA: hypothetical protein VGO52_14295 [Hyphomonadaceae bacterium]|nr:hypothetical protein [Hyphomonadaceae bacterium]